MNARPTASHWQAELHTTLGPVLSELGLAEAPGLVALFTASRIIVQDATHAGQMLQGRHLDEMRQLFGRLQADLLFAGSDTRTQAALALSFGGLGAFVLKVYWAHGWQAELSFSLTDERALKDRRARNRPSVEHLRDLSSLDAVASGSETTTIN